MNSDRDGLVILRDTLLLKLPGSEISPPRMTP
jgi:hypothetical protein